MVVKTPAGRHWSCPLHDKVEEQKMQAILMGETLLLKMNKRQQYNWPFYRLEREVLAGFELSLMTMVMMIMVVMVMLMMMMMMVVIMMMMMVVVVVVMVMMMMMTMMIMMMMIVVIKTINWPKFTL